MSPELELNQSAIIRYLKAWVAVGVLEQDQKTHKYRLALRWRTECHIQPSVSLPQHDKENNVPRVNKRLGTDNGWHEPVPHL